MPTLIVDKPGEFFDRVGVLWIEDYEGMPIMPEMTSYFREHELPRLLRFVQEHPQYHVISCFPNDIMVNRFDSSAGSWLLGDGDRDPELVRVTTELTWRRYGEALLKAFGGRCSAKSR